MKSHRHFKTLLVTLVMALLLTAALYPFHSTVEERIEGVAISAKDKTQCDPVTLTLDGTYTWQLMGTDVQTNTLRLQVEGAVTMGPEDVTITKATGGAYPPMAFLSEETAEVHSILGDFSRPFSPRNDLIIHATDSYAPSSLLVFPASTREEALSLLHTYDAALFELYQ